MTREDAVETALTYYDDGKYFDELRRRVAIPTECQDPKQVPELYRYLRDEMTPAFEAMGYNCRIFDNPMPGLGPFFLAHRFESESSPTILGYGHGDVVLGQEGQWLEGLSPWEMTERGDKIYGRGIADNKGQHTLHMNALEAIIETRGKLGFNHKFLVETGEENGSKGLDEFVAANKDALSADVFLASDGPRVDMDSPNLVLGNRGIFGFELSCELRDGGHHSGNWGGLLANPAIILAHAVSSLINAKGKILAPDLLPAPMPNSVRVALKDVKRNGGGEAPEVDEDWGEPGLTTAEQVYGWNSLDILAMKTGNPDNPVNAIPPKAWALCQIRYVVGSKDDDFMATIRKHLDSHGFDMVEVKKPSGSNTPEFKAARTDPDNPWARWAAQALEKGWGSKVAVLPNSGGSICNHTFQNHLGTPTIWIPLSYSACSQHAPNEHILKSLTRQGMELVTSVYWDLGENAPAKS
jgi:acetylornithine deacetylase/succinyl-diaminopimelate desuccinylase-like protein